jgi:outer membrane lipoprotein-sorting protein
MRQSFLFSIFAAAMTLAAPLALQAAAPSKQLSVPTIRPNFSENDRADLKRVSTYLNGLRSVEGRFTQVNADGKTEQGSFFLKKPGRIRFEYGKPNPNVVVADGTTVAVENSSLKTTDRYPITNSPLRLLLSDNMDLSLDPRVSAIKREAGAVSVTAREQGGPASGSITLTLADSGGNLELRQWQVVDAQGAHTTVVVNEMREVADIPADLFIIQDLSPFKRNGR